MIQTKIMAELDKVLKKDEQRYYLQGVLNKAKVIEDLYDYNSRLLTLLSENKIISEHFILNINNNKIIKINELIELFELNEYWNNSYTSYENKIGLASNRRYIYDNEDVVLDFPYKDTILKASMSKEDTDQGDLLPEEPFLNEVMAKEEIDTLLDDKTFINGKKYDRNKVQEIEEFDSKDNLIIKGNNLVALHSLKANFAHKVKLIYIDPPYYFDKNKASDTFDYNSNFKLSTWLTFMKNRLEVARELLADDGAIFVSTGNDGQAYLKILMDDIFGKDNYVETFIWKNTDNANTLGSKSRKDIEFIHAYEKTYQKDKKWIGKMSQNDDAPLLNRGNKVNMLTFPKKTIFFNIADGSYEKGTYGRIELLEKLTVKDGKNEKTIKIKGEFKWNQDNLEKEISLGTYFLVKTEQFSIRYQKVEATEVAPEKFIDESYLEKTIGVGVYEDSNTHLRDLDIDFKYSKPESLIAFIIRAVTEENDIVLDFFMGSGTTQAVAHKMKRQYIGIEQMDYIDSATIPRLQKVIDGEDGGVSKDINWQGGGSFISLELLEKNTGYLKDVINAESIDQLREVFNRMLKYADLDFRIDLNKIKKSIWSESFKNQKRILIKIIDKNQLYYNYSEIDDENIREFISDSDYAFNKSFYDKEDNNE